MSYQKILTVVNEHTASVVTARYAIALAAESNAGLVLYAAHDEGSNEVILRRTEQHQKQLSTVAFEQNIPVTSVTEVGSIRTLLPKRVQMENSDLVLYPLSPQERWGVTLKRHTVNHLLRTVRSDLVIMRVIAMVKPHPAHILVPLGKSGGDTAGHRMTFVAALAKSFNAQVTLLHLSKTNGLQGMPEGVTRFREQLEQQNITTLERHGAGRVGEAVGVEAITHHNDLIVLGASERGAFRNVLLGNPAGDIMHHPPCNCILFRSAL